MEGNESETHLSQPQLEQRGIEAIDNGNLPLGFDLLSRLPAETRSPVVRSYLACCIAAELGLVDEAKALCTEAMEREPVNPLHYLNLGRVHLIEGDKKEAIRMFRDGLLYGNNRLIKRELEKLGRRTPPVFPSLGREHPLNRMLGVMRKKLRAKG